MVTYALCIFALVTCHNSGILIPALFSIYSTPRLHYYRMTLPIIAFHVVTEYGPDTPDSFFPAALPAMPTNTGKRVWLATAIRTQVVSRASQLPHRSGLACKTSTQLLSYSFLSEQLAKLL